MASHGKPRPAPLDLSALRPFGAPPPAAAKRKLPEWIVRRPPPAARRAPRAEPLLDLAERAAWAFRMYGGAESAAELLGPEGRQPFDLDAAAAAMDELGADVAPEDVLGVLRAVEGAAFTPRREAEVRGSLELLLDALDRAAAALRRGA